VTAIRMVYLQCSRTVSKPFKTISRVSAIKKVVKVLVDVLYNRYDKGISEAH